MTSTKELLYSIKFRHGAVHTPVKLNTETNDQFPLGYILPSLSSLTHRGTYSLGKSFRLMCSVNLPLAWKVSPSSTRNSACFILPAIGLGFACPFFFKTSSLHYLDRLQGIQIVLDQLRYCEITSLAQSVTSL